MLLSRSAAGTAFGDVGEPSRSEQFLLLNRENKRCSALSALHFDVLELLRDNHMSEVLVKKEIVSLPRRWNKSEPLGM